MMSIKKAAIVDYFFPESMKNISEELLAQYQANSGESNAYVFVLTNSVSHKEALEFARRHERSVIVTDENELKAFFSAKNEFDSKDIEKIHVITSESRQSLWKLVILFFTTPVYQVEYSFVRGEVAPEQCDIKEESFMRHCKDFLQSIKPHGELEILKSSLIPDDIFYHGFVGRNGGISTIPGMRSLNLCYTNRKKDPRIVIEENKRRVAELAGFDEEKMHVAKASHSKKIWIVGSDELDSYDGVMTSEYNVTVAAPGADCVMILLADPVKRVCAAVHSGWKGTMLGIVKEAVQKMVSSYGSKPEDILVVMGPSIEPTCFEFGSEDFKSFEKIDPYCVIWKTGQSKPFIDLWRANRILLQREGVQAHHIDDTSATLCTVCHPVRFFSFRRDGFPFGNQIGFIGIRLK